MIFRGPPNLKKKNFTEWLSPVRINSLKLMRTKSEIVIIVSFNRPLDVRQVLQRDGSFLGGSRVKIIFHNSEKLTIIYSYIKIVLKLIAVSEYLVLNAISKET